MRTRLSRTPALVITVALLLGASLGSTLAQSHDPFAYAYKIMSNRPLPATDPALVALDYFSIPKAEPAWGPEPTAEQAYILLSLYIQAASRNDRSQIGYVMSLFNDPEVKQKVPTPSLRAALLGLYGSVASSAFDFGLHAQTPAGLPKVKDIRFDDDAALGGRYWLATTDEKTQQITILLACTWGCIGPMVTTPSCLSTQLGGAGTLR